MKCLWRIFQRSGWVDYNIPEDHHLLWNLSLWPICAEAKQAWKITLVQFLWKFKNKRVSQPSLNWVPEFCSDIEECSSTDFYQGLAKLTMGYLKSKKIAWRTKLWNSNLNVISTILPFGRKKAGSRKGSFKPMRKQENSPRKYPGTFLKAQESHLPLCLFWGDSAGQRKPCCAPGKYETAFYRCIRCDRRSICHTPPSRRQNNGRDVEARTPTMNTPVVIVIFAMIARGRPTGALKEFDKDTVKIWHGCCAKDICLAWLKEYTICAEKCPWCISLDDITGLSSMKKNGCRIANAQHSYCVLMLGERTAYHCSPASSGGVLASL